MQKVTAEFVKEKKVLLRYDLDVAIDDGVVIEDFKLKAGLPTLNLCIQNASKIIIVGHIGRPSSPNEFSAKPVFEWFKKQLQEKIEFATTLSQAENITSKIVLLENIRFFRGEVEGDVDFARQLASLADVYVNEAFSAYNIAASTTIVPTLLPSVAGLHFVKEVETLTNVRNNPKKPFVAIMGGAKVNDKLPVIQLLSQKADAVLVGGKLVSEIKSQNLDMPANVLVGKMTEDGFDISPDTTDSWRNLIMKAAMIVWNGPLGKFEDPQNDQTKKIAQMVIDSGAESIIGGGDIITALNQYGLLNKFSFVSVGGGAMLKLLSSGSLPTIEALA